ncbi:MAG: hypothetical protein NVS3B21_06450 [Acidimicrobiales bacterium]
MSRFLVDENLSPALAASLVADGHDAVHVNDVGLSQRPDAQILGWAARQDRTVITADHDFHEHLFVLGAVGPSVVRLSQRGPDALAGTRPQAERLRALVPALEPYLAAGIAVSVDHRRISITPLPLQRRLQRLPAGRTADGLPTTPDRRRGVTADDRARAVGRSDTPSLAAERVLERTRALRPSRRDPARGR